MPHTQPIEKKRYGTLGRLGTVENIKFQERELCPISYSTWTNSKRKPYAASRATTGGNGRATATPDKAFFDGLTPEETRLFLEESKAFLTEFVGAENVISAMVHMDEKTPHMHFLHVPVTPDGRLNANKIYTRQSLRKLQAGLPAHLQSRGFVIERGVEQTPGSAKRHLDTREFKQQHVALEKLIQ